MRRPVRLVRLGSLALLVALAACSGGGGTDAGAAADPPGATASGTGTGTGTGSGTEIPDGALTLVALGDSLTAGEGDEAGEGGFVGRIAAALDGRDDRDGVELVNLGQSGWDSTNMVEGQLPDAVAAVAEAVDAGRPVVATVLIGSNDLWYVYDATPEGEDTTPAAEDDMEELYRANLERTVDELLDVGATVVLGLPDDQVVRPGVVDIDVLHSYLPNVTPAEVEAMSPMADRLGAVVAEVAEARGLATVDTNSPLWSSTETMADDGIHPNAAGYDELAALWLAVLTPLL